MNPLHIVANKKDIAKVVLLPGDPLRAKYIAENFLDDYKLVTNTRNMLGYTGYYKDKRITVMGSGMGIASAALYAYELYEFYDVKHIIRIGSAGSLNENIHIKDIILSQSAYSESSFRKCLLKSSSKKASSSNYLNQIIINTAKDLEIKIIKGTVYTTDIFDGFINIDYWLKKVPKNIKLLASEMEAFGLFTMANYMHKDASALLSITDNKLEPDKTLTPNERQTSLNKMITLALESIKKAK